MTGSGEQHVTADQHAHMHVLWAKAGITDRAQRLALTSAAVGREIDTSADLTRREASRLIDYMLYLDAAGALEDRAREYLADRAKAGA